MTDGCTHCVRLPGSCCLCEGTRRIHSELVTTWLWAYNDCACDACRALLSMRKETRIRPTIVMSSPDYRFCWACGTPHVADDPMKRRHRCEPCTRKARSEINRRYKENRRAC